MTDAWNMYPSMAVHGMVKAMEAKMKKSGIAISNVRLKNGKLVKTDKTPPAMRAGKKKKAARQVKAWTKAGRK